MYSARISKFLFLLNSPRADYELHFELQYEIVQGADVTGYLADPKSTSGGSAEHLVITRGHARNRRRCPVCEWKDFLR